MNLFQYLYSICNKYYIDFDNLSEEDRKKWSSFMILKYLSMDKNLLPIVNTLNTIENKFTDKELYIILFNIIPRGRYDFTYLGEKTAKVESFVGIKKSLKLLYQLTDKEAEMYLKIIPTSEYITYIQMAGMHE
jgi:hypothetical protein